MKCLNVALFLKKGRGQRETGCKYFVFFGGGGGGGGALPSS